MNLKFLCTLTCFLILCFATFGQDIRVIKRAYGTDTLAIEYGDDVVWMTIDQIDSLSDENNFQTFAFAAKWNGKLFKRNRSVAIDGQRKTIEFFSSDTAIIEFLRPTSFVNQGFFQAKNVGAATVYAVFDQTDTISIELESDAVQILSIFGDDAVLQFIGKPDRVTEKTIPYNREEVVDGILYNTADQLRGRRVIHWMYDKYPGAVLVLNPVEYREHIIVQQPSWLRVARQLHFNF